MKPKNIDDGGSIGQYLIKRLKDYGIADIFGIPGDYVLSFYSELEKSDLNVVGCTREDCAGFAADAYARLRGMGAMCVTYCVGGLSVCNSVAGAYAEKSPVVVISGSPGLKERSTGALLHHMVRDFRTQFDVFEKFTIASAELNDPTMAKWEIDRVLDACDRFKRPVYLEIPRDMVHVVPTQSQSYPFPAKNHDPDATAEAVRETVRRLAEAKKPVILAGVEIHRFRLQDELLKLAEDASIPIATTMLGKSVVSEKHPLFVGLYEGALGDPAVTQMVEESDLILLLGAFLSDINLGIYTANLDPGKCVYVTSEDIRISHHHYRNVDLRSFLVQLNRAEPTTEKRSILPFQVGATGKLHHDHAPTDNELTTSWMIARLNHLIDADTIVIADVGDSLFAATELTIHERGEFLSPAYYTSMGFSVPAALGAATARRDHRVVVLVGDGAFQMTGQEFSSLIRDGHAPIIIVLDNHGYGTERYLHAGDWKYNEIQPWKYGTLTEVYGGGESHMVATEQAFETALRAAWSDSERPHLIHAKLRENDASETLKKLAQRMSENVE